MKITELKDDELLMVSGGDFTSLAAFGGLNLTVGGDSSSVPTLAEFDLAVGGNGSPVFLRYIIGRWL